MSKLSTVLTVKSGSTTKTVSLYSSTSDITSGSSSNEYLTCKCNGSTAYIAVAASGTAAYNAYGTDLKYKNSAGNIRYICTEPYVEPSYSGTLTIPTLTVYNNSSSSAYEATILEVWDSGILSGGLKSGDTILIPGVSSAFRMIEGTGAATSTFSASSAVFHLCYNYSTGTGSTSDLASWSITGQGVPGGEGGTSYTGFNATTVNITTSITRLYLVCTNLQLIARAQLSIYHAITLNIN